MLGKFRIPRKLGRHKLSATNQALQTTLNHDARFNSIAYRA
jgi:hypothetical protein